MVACKKQAKCIEVNQSIDSNQTKLVSAMKYRFIASAGSNDGALTPRVPTNASHSLRVTCQRIYQQISGGNLVGKDLHSHDELQHPLDSELSSISKLC